MARHPSFAELYEYMQGGSSVRTLPDAVALHFQDCAKCKGRIEEFNQLTSLIAISLHRDSSPDDDASTDADRDADGLQLLLRTAERIRAEELTADDVWSILQPLPLGEWQAFLKSEPRLKNEGLVRRLVKEAMLVLRRIPAEALAFLDIARGVAADLTEPNVRAGCLADIHKNIGTALLVCGRYDAALTAVSIGENHARADNAGAFVFAELREARATILTRIGRYVEARTIANEAAHRFAEFGATRRVADCRMIEAVALSGFGNFDESLRVSQLARQTFEKVGDTNGSLPGLIQNIAWAQLQLGNLSEAESAAKDAESRLMAAGRPIDAIRCAWTLASIDLAREQFDDGLANLTAVANRFLEYGSNTDAGMVKIDIVEELTRQRRYDEAVLIAEEAVQAFADSGARLHLMTALSQLHVALRRRTATRELVRDVRAYIQADDPSRPFSPRSARESADA
jgi:tetratricopeptide (TPR) repeat protein